VSDPRQIYHGGYLDGVFHALMLLHDSSLERQVVDPVHD
jgi:hypothetical protein